MDLNELTFENLGVWPAAAKAVVVGLVAITMIGGGFWLVVRPEIHTLNTLKATEVDLKNDFELKSAQAASLAAYKAQIQTMHQQFSALVQQLPNSADIPNLIEDISKIGVSNGLEFRLIKPEPEVNKVFYMEMPIKIFVTGTYNQLASFISGVSALQRIVTFNNFTIAKPGVLKPEDGDQVSSTPSSAATSSDVMTTTPIDKLDMEIEARTYRYVEEPKQ